MLHIFLILMRQVFLLAEQPIIVCVVCTSMFLFEKQSKHQNLHHKFLSFFDRTGCKASFSLVLNALSRVTEFFFAQIFASKALFFTL